MFLDFWRINLADSNVDRFSVNLAQAEPNSMEFEYKSNKIYYSVTGRIKTYELGNGGEFVLPVIICVDAFTCYLMLKIS